jgi:hypothetical protein
VSSAYVLQSNRGNFNKNKVDPTCMICGLDAEDIEHFVLNCWLLENARKPIIAEITKELYNICKTNLSQLMKNDQLRIIMNCSILCQRNNITHKKIKIIELEVLECHCRRLIYMLHSTRYRLLENVDRETVVLNL